MALKFSMILEAIDRASAPAKRAKASMAGLTSGFRAWGRQVRKVSSDIQSGARSVDFYRLRAERLRRVALGRFFQAASNDARRFANSLRAGIRNLDLMGRAGRGAKAGLGWLGGKALGFAGSTAKWAAAGAGAVASFSIFDLFKTAGQFEQFQVVLEGTEGSAAKAKKAMAWVQKFAKDTPYELEEVTDAFVRARGLGIDPFTGAMKIMGDAAAGTRKSIMDAVEAIGDAQTGEFERLKEFQITTSTKGQSVTFSYIDKGGKNVFKTVKKDAVAIREALLDIWSYKYSGNMVRLSRTFFGILNNIKDVWSNFLMMVANAGIFDKVKAKLDQWYQKLNSAAGNKKMLQWAQAISDKLSEAFDWGVKFAEQTDWAAVGRGLGTALVAMTKLIALFGQAVDRFYQWQAYRAANMAENTEKGWFSSASAKANAKARRQAIEAKYGVQTETGRKEAADRAQKNRFYRVTPGGKDIPKGVNPGWSRLPQSGATTRAPFKVGGALDINVKVQGPGTARVERVQTANRDVPINARVGKVMGAPA